MDKKIEELKALALAVEAAPIQRGTSLTSDYLAFADSANPAAILELIARIEQLTSELELTRSECNSTVSDADLIDLVDAQSATIRELDAIGMALGARLAQMHTSTIKGHYYLLRDSVMREVVEWRRMWGMNSAARKAHRDARHAAAELAAAGSAQCIICGSDAPRTGACGSSDSRALCNLTDRNLVGRGLRLAEAIASEQIAIQHAPSDDTEGGDV